MSVNLLWRGPVGERIRERNSGMSIIGKVESLWRYPVKSMQGEELDEVFINRPPAWCRIDWAGSE